MFARTITSFFFATTLALSLHSGASGASLKAPNSTAASEIPSSLQPLSKLEQRSLSFKETLPGLPEVARAQYADTCYTFAGPTCPMRVLVPEGAPCTCYFSGGALAGQAW